MERRFLFSSPLKLTHSRNIDKTKRPRSLTSFYRQKRFFAAEAECHANSNTLKISRIFSLIKTTMTAANRRLQLLQLLNCLGVSYLFLVITSVFLTDVFYCCPQLYGFEECRLPILIGIFVVISILLNLIFFTLMARKNRATPQSLSGQNAPQLTSNSVTFRPNWNSPSNVLPTDFKFCRTCGFHVSQQSHHCPLCGFCVVRKDHHCFLTGNCVGAANQRYFVAFLFWAAIGCTMGSWYLGTYLAQNYQPIRLGTLIFYFFPFAVVRFFFTSDDFTFGQLLLLAQFGVALMSSIASTAFLTAQLISVATGTTMLDWISSNRLPSRHTDSATVKQRFRAVFGPYWLLNFIFPTNFSNLKYCSAASDLLRIPSKEV